MKENPIIVQVALSDSNLKSHSVSATGKDTLSVALKLRMLKSRFTIV